VAESEDRGGGFVTGLLLGALGGVVIAALATPRVNETIAGSALVERGRSIVDAARARLDGAISEGRDAAERQRSALEEGA
jgi:hypothetical protein